MIREITNLSRAARTSQHHLPPPQNPTQGLGLTYQRSLGRALVRLERFGARIYPEPWFEYEDSNGSGLCAPDFILEIGDLSFVIEAKRTFVEEAVMKMRGLYLPVIISALNKFRVRPLIICRTLTPDSPPSVSSILAATSYKAPFIPTMLWRGGNIPWTES